jgi:hypothetical protein
MFPFWKPTQLKKVDDSKWNLVTGDKRNYTISESPIWQLKWVSRMNYDMVHTENFVLVDAKEFAVFMTALTKEDIKVITDINLTTNS